MKPHGDLAKWDKKQHHFQDCPITILMVWLRVETSDLLFNNRYTAKRQSSFSIGNPNLTGPSDFASIYCSRPDGVAFLGSLGNVIRITDHLACSTHHLTLSSPRYKTRGISVVSLDSV
ncbi:hypothetical protein CEXT_488411 [Caerostris extrusa]|uniref:Uncharacterized protein n=1 Tax=Caerostris extrusa TaxID=172846 RepID=A0AAV4M7M3_CAEEX|nr:hypothetical protein CEXT_488411 [Caerostris extrusa]